MIATDLLQPTSEGATLAIYFFSSCFFTTPRKCVEHPHVQAPKQCESRRVEKKKIKIGGKQRQCRGRKQQALRVSEHVRVDKRGRGKHERKKRAWNKKAQTDIAITKKTTLQLGIHFTYIKTQVAHQPLPLRLTPQHLIYNWSTPKGHHWVATVHKRTIYRTGCLWRLRKKCRWHLAREEEQQVLISSYTGATQDESRQADKAGVTSIRMKCRPTVINMNVKVTCQLFESYLFLEETLRFEGLAVRHTFWASKVNPVKVSL